MTAQELMQEIDLQLAHVWMVRTFLKHCEEAEEDEELREVHREFYDFALALGAPFKNDDAESYLKTASKKLGKLKKAVELFREIQPEVSTHTNFQMAVRSVSTSVQQIACLLEQAKAAGLTGPKPAPKRAP